MNAVCRLNNDTGDKARANEAGSMAGYVTSATTPVAFRTQGGAEIAHRSQPNLVTHSGKECRAWLLTLRKIRIFVCFVVNKGGLC